jgi:hypothetical protein
MSIIDTIIQAAKEVETAEKLDKLNHTLKEIQWISVGLLMFGLDDGGLTPEKVIASVILMYVVIGVTGVISFFWYNIKIGYVRGMKKREEAKKLKVTRNA